MGIEWGGLILPPINLWSIPRAWVHSQARGATVSFLQPPTNPEKANTMSDVKKFTGFIAVDGSTHTSMKAATEHSRIVKTKKALAEAFGGQLVSPADVPNHELEDRPDLIVKLDEFIFSNRLAIQFALNQEVTTRKPRTPKVKAPAAPAAPETPDA